MQEFFDIIKIKFGALMKKLILFLFVIITLCGCTNIKNNDTKEHITVWTLQMGDFADYMNGIIEEYEKKNPEVVIEWVDVPFSEGEKRTLAAVLGNNPPDLINLNPDFSALLAQRGALQEVPLNKMSNYNSQVIEALKYNNKLYSIPWYATSSVTFVNKELLNKTDIGKEKIITKKTWKRISRRRYGWVTEKETLTPQPFPISYTQMNNNAKKVKKLTDAYIYTPNLVDNDSMLRILNKYGINSPDKVNSEEAVNLFNQFRELYQSGYLPRETVSITHREAFEQYMSNKSVFFQAGANFLNMLKENAPSVYAVTDIHPQLIGSRGQYDFSLMNFVIPIKAANKEHAFDFALFVTNTENQLNLAKKTNVLATTKRALSSGFYNDYSTKEGKARSYGAKQLNKLEPVLKQYRNQKELNTIVNTAVQKILTDKNTPVQVILDKLSKDWTELIKEF